MSRSVVQKRLGSAWESYLRDVIPADADAIQIEETRRGFYAGAGCLLAAVMGALSPGPDATDYDVAVLEDIAAELTEHLAGMRRLAIGRASS